MKANTLSLKYRKYMKHRLIMFRASGLIMSIACLVLVAIQHFGLVDSIWNAVSILYMCGFLFTLNGQYQEVCRAKGFAKASRFIAMIFYIATVALLILLILQRFSVVSL